ncbi:MAG: zinc ribbon domain-containing protein [Paracoccaceae bacterium]|nr:transposase [Maritimibacter sp.]
MNLFLGDDGKLKAALTRDLTEVFSESRDAYHPLTDVLSLDFGLRSLFATNFGDLLGRGFLGKIEPVAKRADAEAARMQKAGKKPRESERYLKLVTRLRAMIETEVNRVLNHAVALYRPRVLAVEKLDFRDAGLGRRMNRLLTNCGRGAVAKKLADLEERYGIEIQEVEPAYTSKTCSCCGYVDAKQRAGEKFHCRHCGRKMHADVNGARNIAKAVSAQPADHETAMGDGRSALPGASSPTGRKRSRKASSSPRTRSFTLRDIVRRFDESVTDLGSVSRPRRGKSGARESAPDPRLTNPYWRRHSALLKGKSAGPRNEEAAVFAVAT